MITSLKHHNIEVSRAIRNVFQVSYKVEADLLKAKDFPPLKRSLENFMTSKTQFFGFQKDEELAGVIEVNHTANFTHINSLVVDPKFFRQGIGEKLMEFVFETFDSNLFVVETGLENGPATKLYKKLGFKEVKQWDTEFGIRKIKFEKTCFI